MKSRSFRVAALAAFILTSPLLIFAAGQPKLHMLSKSEMQDLSGATRAVQQGKGTGMTRNTLTSQPVLPTHDESAAERLGPSDSAFRK
jgi:hypothetical protein